MRNIIMIVLGVMAMLLLAQQGSTEPISPNVTSNVISIKVTAADEAFINKIVSIAKIPKELATQIVDQAEELSYKDFPKKSDILSVIAVESMFRNNVSDGLGSCGLMQVNAKANNLDPIVVCSLPMTNMIHGVEILRANYKRLGDPRKALLTYNAGIGNFLKGNFNEGYYLKFLTWKEKLDVLRRKGN